MPRASSDRKRNGWPSENEGWPGKKKSSNRRKARRKVARIHARAADRRKTSSTSFRPGWRTKTKSSPSKTWPSVACRRTRAARRASVTPPGRSSCDRSGTRPPGPAPGSFVRTILSVFEDLFMLRIRLPGVAAFGPGMDLHGLLGDARPGRERDPKHTPRRADGGPAEGMSDFPRRPEAGTESDPL